MNKCNISTLFPAARSRRRGCVCVCHPNNCVRNLILFRIYFFDSFESASQVQTLHRHGRSPHTHQAKHQVSLRNVSLFSNSTCASHILFTALVLQACLYTVLSLQLFEYLVLDTVQRQQISLIKVYWRGAFMLRSRDGAARLVALKV